MQTSLSKILVLSLILAGACGGAAQPPVAKPEPVAEPRKGLQIKLVSVYVDDQEKALRFYTETLGFTKKDDFSNSGFRWLSVTDGANELQLALNDNPAAKAYQQALFQQSQPAVMFYTADIKADYERIKGHGAKFTMPPTDVTMSTIAMLEDTCGNLVQITELKR